MAKCLKPGANPELIKICTRQVQERANPTLQELEGAKEGLLLVRIRSFDSGWILEVPMCD